MCYQFNNTLLFWGMDPRHRFLGLPKCKQGNGREEGMLNIDDEVPKERTAEMRNRAWILKSWLHQSVQSSPCIELFLQSTENLGLRQKKKKSLEAIQLKKKKT